jgi:very-short-patch-repair endonuclease
LIIEVDGGVHNEREVLYLDQVKQELLNQKWLQVLRIKNEDVLNNMNTVLRDICNKLTK